METLVSIIMPVYNAERYVEMAIASVLRQTHANWELLVVNDGSTDNSASVIKRFSDPRIHYFEQQNKGVSAARNAALEVMKGNYFCFLDADDVLTDASLELRLEEFKREPALTFADGSVDTYDAGLDNLLKCFRPSFKGNPFQRLMKLDPACFFGPTWMVRRNPEVRYRMNEAVRHSEDLLFYLELTRRGGVYGYTTGTILKYRVHSVSAMQNLDGLYHGYKQLSNITSRWSEVNLLMRMRLLLKVKKIMFLSYWAAGRYRKAITSLI